MKKIIIISICVLFVAVVALFVFVILNEDMTPPDLPIESKSNKVTVTSNGCCLWVEDVTIFLSDGAGNKQVLAEIPKVYEHDIFNMNIPNIDNEYGEVLVSCKYYYGDYYDFSESFKVDSIYDLRQKGLLIYFQEADGAYLNVKMGSSQVSYKLNYDTKSWDKLDVPNKLYASD